MAARVNLYHRIREYISDIASSFRRLYRRSVGMKRKDCSVPLLGAHLRRSSGIQMQRTLRLPRDGPRATTFTISILRQAMFGHRFKPSLFVASPNTAATADRAL